MGWKWMRYGVCTSFTCSSLSLIVITASFQDSEDNPGSETDDEEMEARKVAQEDDMVLVD
jgi:hypothetical protein